MTRNYLLIGAGGTGSQLFPNLTRYLESRKLHHDEPYLLTVIDGKGVNASKLDRQLFFGRYAGSNKALALAEQYGSDPTVVIAIPHYLGDDLTAIGDNDVVLIAADNFPVRARIEARAQELDNITVINGGNEMIDGSLQTYLRRDGADITPPMSQGHPELLADDGRDPASLSCDQIAELPGGEQTLLANMQSAVLMLNALRRVHEWEDAGHDTDLPLGTEVFFDLNHFAMRRTARPT